MRRVTRYLCDSCDREYYDPDFITPCLGCDKDVCNSSFCRSVVSAKYHQSCYIQRGEAEQ